MKRQGLRVCVLCSSTPSLCKDVCTTFAFVHVHATNKISIHSPVKMLWAKQIELVRLASHADARFNPHGDAICDKFTDSTEPPIFDSIELCGVCSCVVRWGYRNTNRSTCTTNKQTKTKTKTKWILLYEPCITRNVAHRRGRRRLLLRRCRRMLKIHKRKILNIWFWIVDLRECISFRCDVRPFIWYVTPYERLHDVDGPTIHLPFVEHIRCAIKYYF